MNRPLFAWSLFGICLLVTSIAVGWLSQSAWRADQARQRALQESEMRNALWRMDSLVAPLLAIEINRPSFAITFSSTPMLAQKLVKGYVVRDTTGRWTIQRKGRLNEREILTADCPLVRKDWEIRLRSDVTLNKTSGEFASMSTTAITPREDLIRWPEQTPDVSGELVAVQRRRTSRNDILSQEVQNRSQLVQRLQQFAQTVQQPVQEIIRPPAGVGPLRPMWVAGELVLAREVAPTKPSSTTVIEICWLNWPEWEALLSAELSGVSIPLRLEPVQVRLSGASVSRFKDWQMVSLPIRLEPVPPDLPGPWPLPLVAVWGLLLFVALAFAWLMRQTLNLSERRAAFVSAVTHELRTPLTTFRLYTEMLNEGLATDPEQQQHYFQTLHREANRLTHLVENVLAYARLEHGRATARNETLTVGDLFIRCRPRLEQRVGETPLSLCIQFSDEAETAKLIANPVAVEQILFNLIDNSCKYALEALDPRIVCEVRIDGDSVCIRVADFGPGLSAVAHRTLFQPFQKSSSEAAESAPGVGLGLALSHRLAGDMGGSLQCRCDVPTGLCFEIQLPLAKD